MDTCEIDKGQPRAEKPSEHTPILFSWGTVHEMAELVGALYYGSSLGRFMTPDWPAKPIAVPYANYGN